MHDPEARGTAQDAEARGSKSSGGGASAAPVSESYIVGDAAQSASGRAARGVETPTGGAASPTPTASAGATDDAPAMSRSKDNSTCRFWPKCKLGARCKFQHPDDVPTAAAAHVKICRFWPNCTQGSTCKFSHPSASAPSGAAQQPQHAAVADANAAPASFSMAVSVILSISGGALSLASLFDSLPANVRNSDNFDKEAFEQRIQHDAATVARVRNGTVELFETK